MVQIGLIGIAAGAASALLFASIASGSPLSIPLFYLAPLPILIAGIGWSHVAALVAALLAAAGLALVFGGFFFLSFLIGIGLPAWWLSYLALLARPTAGAAGGLEWYPIGRLVLWTAVLSALVVAIAIANLGTDAESFQASLRTAFERILRMPARGAADAPTDASGIDPRAFVDFLVLVVPPTAAVLATLTNVVALWLAARVVRISGRLTRPWPDIAAMTFPPLAWALFVLAVIGTFMPGLVGIMAGVLTASLLIAYALLGLAVVHVLTRGLNARGLILGAFYAVVAVFGWPILLMAFVGLTDAALDLRRRAAARRGPPTLRA